MRKNKGYITKLIKSQMKVNKELSKEFRLFSVECDHAGMIRDGYVSRCFCPNDGVCFNHAKDCRLNHCPKFHSAISYSMNFCW